ncbi:MAG TPA: hypothetical protein ENI29_06670 [bacterium]|nr:hypothetical protein [bacterium]
MIYLEEKLNLDPASPEYLDNYVDIAQKILVPACKRLGSRLVVAWFSNIDWFCQVTQIMEFDDLESLKSFRKNSCQDSEWGEYLAYLAEFAPVRKSMLLEPFGPVPPKTLHDAIIESQEKPIKNISVAMLEMDLGKVLETRSLIKRWSNRFPIIASWRLISGAPNSVIDIWKGNINPVEYTPSSEGMNQLLRELRDIIPKERLRTVNLLPFSQLH